MRVRTNKTFKYHNNRKIIKTFDLLGCSQSFFKRRIPNYLYGDMTEKNYGSVWTLDHCYILSKTKLSIVDEMNKSIYRINLRPRYLTENSPKGSKKDNHLYLLQEVKTKYFFKLYDHKGHNEDLH